MGDGPSGICNNDGRTANARVKAMGNDDGGGGDGGGNDDAGWKRRTLLMHR